MYLHIGQGLVVLRQNVIGIFDLDNSSRSYRTRDFLNNAERQNQVVTVGDDLPRSFTITCENGVTTIYLSQISASTLAKRYESETVE
jgi:hypothetical protein